MKGLRKEGNGGREETETCESRRNVCQGGILVWKLKDETLSDTL